MIDPERFQQVDALFDGALALPGEERDAYLARESGGDQALEAEVRALLASMDAAESLLGENVAEFAAPLLSSLTSPEEDVPLLPPGERLGPWRIVRPLGRGGMGEVYLAERDDGAFQLQAAVKVVKRGMDTDEVLRRFGEERRILASLDHPNIARVLDAGATGDGRPYLVLEYVEGEPIDRWCDTRRMDIRERVALFRQLCEAVDQAHRRLIVHRDVKPSNVLVGVEGVPKLLDFGIAKLLEADGEATATAARLLTPRYAAPEQRVGGPVTTATDVYSLGRLLYLLLAGVNPGEVEAAAHGAAGSGGPDRPPLPPSTLFRLGSTGAPPPSGGSTGAEPAGIAASRNSSPARLRETLRGDLDTIVLRAMASDPDRRYPSALQLSEDLGRWLDGLPVRARPDSLAYRAGKFIRRNRGGVTAGLMSLLLVLASVVALAVAQKRTAEALARAEVERDTAEEVAGLLQGVFSAGDPMTTRQERLDTLRVGALLDRSTLRIREELRERPELRARLLQTLGETYRGMGLLEAADTLLRDAVALRREQGEGERLSRALNALAVLGLQSRRDAEAVELLREALALGAGTPEHREGLQANLASALQNVGEFHEAARLYQEVEEQILASPTPDSTRLALVISARGVLAHRMGDLATSTLMLERTLELDRARLGADHWRVGLATVNLAFARQRDDRLDEADSLYSEGVEVIREGLGREHPLHYNSLAAQASVRSRRGLRAEAGELYAEALPGLRRVEGEGPNVALVLSQYAGHLAGSGDAAGAEAAYLESVAIATRVQGEAHPDVGSGRALFAHFLCGRGRTAEGAEQYREALRILEAALPPDHHRIVDARGGLAGCQGEGETGG